MQTLNLPEAILRIRQREGKQEVFDIVRKKFVAFTAEEWVRQHVIHYLIGHRNVPGSLINVEAALKVNRLKKRSDIVVFGKDGPCLVVECKAPEVALSQDVFNQAAMYNMTLKVPFLVVTNGLVHFACHIDHSSGKIAFLKEIPLFEDLVKR